jgi:hypothetical protein
MNIDSSSDDSSAHSPNLEFGWKVHDLLDTSIGKVDAKASIVLAIETAAAGFTVSLSDKHERLAGLHGWRNVLYEVGWGFLALAVLLSLLAVLPHMGRRASKRDWKGNMIYFGHLRHWRVDDLQRSIESPPQQNEQLAKQLQVLAATAWRKHSLLQFSIVAFLSSLIALFLAGR